MPTAAIKFEKLSFVAKALLEAIGTGAAWAGGLRTLRCLPISARQLRPDTHSAAALDVSVKRIADGVPAVIVLVDNNRQHLARLRIDLVRIQPALFLQVLAALVNHNAAETLQMGDAVFDRAFPFLGWHDVEAAPAHVADRLGT